MIVQIQPVQLWVAGETKTASQFSLITVMDDLATSATTYYQLQDAEGATLSQGNQTINGQEYIDWNSNPDANTWICNWSLAQLGLTLQP